MTDEDFEVVREFVAGECPKCDGTTQVFVPCGRCPGGICGRRVACDDCAKWALVWALVEECTEARRILEELGR